jgi:hypothetical protein
MPISSSVFPALSCTSFKVIGFILRSSIHFQSIFVQGEKCVSSFCFLHANIQFSQQICWKGCLFSIVCFRHFCQKSGGCCCVDSYLGLLFCSIDLLDYFDCFGHFWDRVLLYARLTWSELLLFVLPYATVMTNMQHSTGPAIVLDGVLWPFFLLLARTGLQWWMSWSLCLEQLWL